MTSRAEDQRRAARIAVALGTCGLGGLTLLGLAYALTYEPAPRVRVEWRESVTEQQRAALERKYLLDKGRDRIPNGSTAYDLLDTSRSNIKALVEDAAVADTADIDREAHAVPFDVEYGEGWMWIAHRTPGIRHASIRRWATIGLGVIAVSGYAVAFFLRRWSA